MVDDRDKEQGKGQERPSRPVTAAARRERRASARPADKSAVSESKAARTSESDKKSDATEKAAKSKAAKSDDDAKSGKAATKGDRKGRPTPARTAKDTRPGLFARLFRFLREVVAELRKVIWPTRKQMITYTVVVLVFVAFMVTLIFAVDFGLTKGIDALFG